MWKTTFNHKFSIVSFLTRCTPVVDTRCFKQNSSILALFFSPQLLRKLLALQLFNVHYVQILTNQLEEAERLCRAELIDLLLIYKYWL